MFSPKCIQLRSGSSLKANLGCYYSTKGGETLSTLVCQTTPSPLSAKSPSSFSETLDTPLVVWLLSEGSSSGGKNMGLARACRFCPSRGLFPPLGDESPCVSPLPELAPSHCSVDSFLWLLAVCVECAPPDARSVPGVCRLELCASRKAKLLPTGCVSGAAGELIEQLPELSLVPGTGANKVPPVRGSPSATSIDSYNVLRQALRASKPDTHLGQGKLSHKR